MKKWLGYFAVLLFAPLAMTGCTSWGDASLKVPEKKRLVEIMKDDGIISLPYTVYGAGVFLVDMQIGDGPSHSFMIDTGATKSALYKSSLNKLGLGYHGKAAMVVHGINSQGARPVVKVPMLKIGSQSFTDFDMVVLEDRLNIEGQKILPIGLIGMDILAQFRVYVDSDNRRFNLIPKNIPSPRFPAKWRTVNLIANPFVEYDHGLHFLEIRLGNYLMPALLDTGAEDNMMNWSISQYPQLKRARKKLYEKWVVEGAVGSFDPRYIVKTRNIRSGQKFWDESEFLVVDFDGLDILGVKEQPFLIAGSPLLAEQTFYIDFAENFMRFKPAKALQRGRTLTSTTTVYNDKNVEQ